MESDAQITKRLYKSRRNRMVDGICGGIAEYFDIDPTIVRILWVLITLLGGSGFFLYIAAMIIMPVNPDQDGVQSGSAPVYNEPGKRRFWGIVLVLIGAFALMINLGWLADLSWWSFSRSVVMPVLFILLGAVLIYTYSRRSSQSPATPPEGAPKETTAPPTQVKELRRSVTDRKVFGVCGGVARYFNVDPTIVRILYVLLVLASLGWGLLLYIILGIVMPEDRPSAHAA